MFYCPLHNWYSSEEPCKACHQTITTTAATSTEPTPDTPEQTTKEGFVWTDGDVIELLGEVNEFFKNNKLGEIIPGMTMYFFKEKKSKSINASHIPKDFEVKHRAVDYEKMANTYPQSPPSKEEKRDDSKERTFTQQQMDEARREAFEAGGSVGNVGVIRKNRRISDDWSFPLYEDYLKTIKQ